MSFRFVCFSMVTTLAMIGCSSQDAESVGKLSSHTTGSCATAVVDFTCDGFSVSGGPEITEVAYSVAGVVTTVTDVASSSYALDVADVEQVWVTTSTDSDSDDCSSDDDSSSSDEVQQQLFLRPADLVCTISCPVCDEFETCEEGVCVPAPGGIDGKVWFDANGDGFKANEPGVVTQVELFGDADGDGAPDGAAPIQTVTCDSNGDYNLSEVAAGDYIVRAIKPASFCWSLGGDSVIANATTGDSTTIHVLPAQQQSGKDLGMKNCPSP